jgi:hypothetical protein
MLIIYLIDNDNFFIDEKKMILSRNYIKEHLNINDDINIKIFCSKFNLLRIDVIYFFKFSSSNF